MIHTIGVASWKKLTAEQQTIFREESTSAGDLMRKLMADGEEDQIKKLEAAGMQVTRPDLAPFRALMEPAYKRIAGYAGEDNVGKFRAMVEAGAQGLNNSSPACGGGFAPHLGENAVDLMILFS